MSEWENETGSRHGSSPSLSLSLSFSLTHTHTNLKMVTFRVRNSNFDISFLGFTSFCDLYEFSFVGEKKHVFWGTNNGGFLICFVLQFHQYQVVGRALPTENDEHPKIYRMKLWATNEVRAKSKFWYALLCPSFFFFFLRLVRVCFMRFCWKNNKNLSFWIVNFVYWCHCRNDKL